MGCLRRIALALVAASIALVPGPAATQESSVERPKRRSDKIEEIVVRARKRDEFLQDTPVSVSALSAQELRDAGITRLDDIQTKIPNTFFQVGRNNQNANLRIRGVGSGSFEIAFDPGVGVYVDGVYLPRALGSLVELFDVSQIEVLRGPQGTLFGKNTVGGAILIRTAKPQPETSGSISYSTGFVRDFDDWNSHILRTTLNVPLIEDKILSRFSFMLKDSEGYVADALQPGDKSDIGSYTFLGSLRFLPTDDLTIDLSGTYGRDHNNGRGGQCVFFNEDAPLKNIIPGFIEACQRSEPFSIATNVDGISDVQSMGVWGTALWDVGEVAFLEEVTVKTIGSWRRQLPRTREDIDSTGLGVIEFSDVGGSPTDGFPGFQQQFTTELQTNASSWEGRINGVAGLFALWESAENEPTTLAGGELGTPLSESTALTEIDNWTWAPFGQITVDFLDWASLTGGARYTRDKKGLNAFVRETIFANGERVGVRQTLPPEGQEPPATGSEVFDEWTFTASLALEMPYDWIAPTPLDFMMGYYTFSQGFRGGGFNGIAGQEGVDELFPFDPETLDNHEFGIKLTAFEDRLTTNLAFFYGDYQDIQVVTIRAVEDPGSVTGLRIERITQNAAEATTMGAELEFRAIPVPGLNLSGSFGWIDATYDEFAEAADELRFCTTEEFNQGQCNRDRSGEGFDRVPRLESSLTIQYEHEIDAGGSDRFAGVLIPQVSWSYRDSYHLFSRQVKPLIQHGYHLLNARLAYEFLEARAEVALWAKNLTDEAYFNEGTPIQSSFGSVTRYFDPPRTFGLELRYLF